MTQEKTAVTSVVMVSYHTGPVLFAAIEAVLAQTVPVELCLVNNGNPFDVVARLQELADKDARLRFVTGYGNIGFSRGCNTGARLAKGDHLLFLNPDSILPPETLQKLLEHRATLPLHAMIGARLVGEDGKDQRGCRRALLTPGTALIEAFHLGPLFPEARLNFTKVPIPSALSPIPAISGAFMFLSKEDFWNLDGFDEGYFLHVEDLDLCLRYTRAGGEIFFAPDIVVTHLGGTSQATTSFIEKHKTRGFIRYFHHNFGDRYPLMFLWILDGAIWARAFLKLGLAAFKGFWDKPRA